MQVETLLGFARRAGALEYGFAASSRAVKAGEIACLLVARDASPRTKRNMEAIAGTIPLVCYGEKKELGQKLGANGEVAVLAVKEGQFARQLLQLTAKNRIGGKENGTDS